MKISSMIALKVILVSAFVTLFSSLAYGQTAALSLSSGTGNPGSVITLNLSLNSTVTQPASLQWTMTYPTKDFSALVVSAGAAASAAGKAVNCNNVAGVSTCVAYSMNSNTIGNGVVATIALTVSSTTTDASSSIQFSSAGATTSSGTAMPTTATGNTVNVQINIAGISCTPDSVIPPAPSTCLVTLSSVAPSGGTTVSLSKDISNVIIPSTVSILAGAASGNFTVTTSSVTADTTAHITATLGSSSANFPLSLVAATPAGISVDATVAQNSAAAGTSIAAPGLSTRYANELVLAFISGGPGTGNLTVSSVSGANLTWVLVQRTNTQKGTAEIWRTFAPTPLSGATVTATFSSSVYSSITVMSFAGVDPTGTSGSGAIGATASANAPSGAPSATLTTSRDGSLVIGVGTDATSAVNRTPPSFQNLVNQYLSPNGNTYWVQTQLNTTPVSGTAVQISDLSPTADAYNLSAVEILAPSYCLPALVPGTRSFSAGGGSTASVIAIGAGCSWTASTNSPTWISFNGGSGSGNGSFTLTVAANTTGQARLGTISAAGTSLEVMEGGTVPVFSDVPVGTQFFDYIALMYQNGITAGCSTTPLAYCPTSSVTRAEMATFVVAAIGHINHGSGQLPPSYTTTPYFQDVPNTNQYFPFIQRLADLGITNGCQANPPLFCPDSPITEGEMAKFVILAWLSYNNATTFTFTQTPYFTDVASTDMFFSYVQKMMDMGFWTGCGGQVYCESSDVTRAQMAPMIMRVLGAP